MIDIPAITYYKYWMKEIREYKILNSEHNLKSFTIIPKTDFIDSVYMNSKVDNNGFTLIELIVVILIASIFGTMMYQYVYTSTVKTSAPIFNLDKSLKLHEILENITSDYLDQYTTDLSGLQTSIGATEGSDQDNDYGSYRVVHNRFIKFVSNSEQTALTADTEYGEVLKVTVESSVSGERLTVLYHKQ
jgi:prepilin-type N-terminal cleavage/methylation domain-containing protein